MWFALGLATFVGLVALGYWIGLGGGSSNTTITLPGGTTTADGCQKACMAWQSSRMDVCTAQANLKAAQDWFNTCGEVYKNATIAAELATAAALLVTWIPFVSTAAAAAASAAIA